MAEEKKDDKATKEKEEKSPSTKAQDKEVEVRRSLRRRRHRR